MSAKAGLARKMDQKTRRWSLVFYLGQRRTTNDERLLAIKLNNQLFVHRQLNVFAFRQRQYAAFEVVAIYFQPIGRILVRSEFFRLLEDRQLATAFANRYLFAHAHLVGRDIDLSAINRNVTMADQLPRLAAGDPETQPQNDTVQPALELLQQQFASHAFSARRFFEIIAELGFLREVDALGLLLLAQLQTITDDLGFAILAMLARSKIALLNGTLVSEALRAFEEQLHALAA